MQYALDTSNCRVDILDSIKDEKYVCPCCDTEVIQKKGNVKEWHYAHKRRVECDSWFEENIWTTYWMNKFPEQFREVVVMNKDSNKKRFANIKVDKLIIQLQSKSMTSAEFQKRLDYFNKENNLVWLVDLRDKDITYKEYKKGKTEQYLWKHAWRFNDINKFSSNFDLFFHIDEDKIIKVIWNKGGFKHFGGYGYSEEEFISFLRRRWRISIRELS